MTATANQEATRVKRHFERAGFRVGEFVTKRQVVSSSHVFDAETGQVLAKIYYFAISAPDVRVWGVPVRVLQCLRELGLSVSGALTCEQFDI